MKYLLQKHDLLFRIMRISIQQISMLLLAVSISNATVLSGQNVLEQRISIKAENKPLKSVLFQIEKEANVRFMYSSKVVGADRKVDVSATRQPLGEILQAVFEPLGLGYRISGEHIILSRIRTPESRLNHLSPLTPRIQAPAERNITGTVREAGGEYLPGVSVLLKGTHKGTVTDPAGKFVLTLTENELTPEAVLVFSFVGFISKEIAVGNRTQIDVELQLSTNQLDELVVVGYGTVKKSDLTGAVVRLDASTFQDQPMTQIGDMLTGTIAGFNANQSTGAAGGSSMEIRGPKSLNASRAPMVVLDGVIYNGSMADINPADIESVDVLKDASSAAVFGARAAAGVILVNTKKSKEGKARVNFTANVGVAGTTNQYKPFDANGYLTFRQDVLRAINPNMPAFYYDNPTQLPAGVTIDQWRAASNNPQTDNTREWLSRLRFFDVESSNYMAGKTVDWYNEVIQKGVRQNYTVSVEGGSKDITYYWSLGYDNNEGVIRGDKFKSIRSRLNIDFKVNNWLSLAAYSQFGDRDQSVVQASLSQMYIMSPYGDNFDENGNIVWFPNTFATPNPLIDYYGQQRYNRANTFFTSLQGKIKLPLGFDYKLSFQPRYNWSKDYNFWPSTTQMGGQTYSNGYGTRNDASSYEYIVDNLLHWNRSFGNHSFDATLLYSIEQALSWSSTHGNQTFVPNQNLGFHGLQYGTNPFLTNSDTKITGDAAMGRINYAFKDRYLFTGSIRRDGYSAFGNENPRAVFPAMAVAWKISEEPFFNINPVSYMKLRLSWGINGNREIGAYSALAQLTSNLYYDGTGVQVGVYNNTLANHGLRWERTTSINLGLDAGLLNNRINATLEYYDMTTTDLLMNRLLPEITGFTSITTNLGELGNRGFELALSSVNVSRSNFNWKSSLVFSLNRNKIKKLFGDYEEVVENGQTIRRELPDYSNEWFPGQPIDRIWNYNMEGIWQEEERNKAQEYRLQPGDIKATDVDGNGVYEGLTDKMFIGYSAPRYRAGLRNEFSFFKNFSASVFIRADLGHLGSFADGLRRGGADTYDRRNAQDFPYWTPENRNMDFPRLTANTNVFGGGIMMYKPMSFVRVQDVSLAYRMPASLLSAIRVDNLRIYASARNLLTFSKWPGWDPESGMAPMPQIFTMGLKFGL